MGNKIIDSKKGEIISEILKIAQVYFKDFVEDSIKNKHITKSEIENLLIKIECSLKNIKKPKAKEKIKDFILEFYKIDYENYVENLLLRRAVKVLKNDVIKRREREKLAEYFAADFLKVLRKIKKEDFIKIKEFLTLSLENLEKNKILIDNLTELTILFSFYYFQKFSEKEIHKILLLLREILKKIEYKEEFETSLQNLSNLFVNGLNIKDYMRKSFTGILIGDLILYSIWKGLGIKEKLSVTDFTIFVGVKVVENQIFRKLKKADVKKIKIEINKVLKKYYP